MAGRLEIGFAPAEGAVPRMLGLVERRGFQLRGITMLDRDGRGSLRLDVEGRSDQRRLDVLAAQLRRLEEVRDVSFSPSESGVPS